MTTWIVTMDGAGARLISRHGASLTLIEEIEHPEGRMKPRELKSDGPGKAFDGGYGQHTMERQESPHQHELAVLTREVGARLDRARQQGEFDKLVLVAGPHLLGMLRSALDKNTARTVHDALAKDLHVVRLDQLMPHLKYHLPLS